jgi:hypothetical protein
MRSAENQPDKREPTARSRLRAARGIMAGAAISALFWTGLIAVYRLLIS